MAKKHTRKDCRGCQVKKIGDGCEIYTDRNDPILDDRGECEMKMTEEWVYELYKERLEKADKEMRKTMWGTGT